MRIWMMLKSRGTVRCAILSNCATGVLFALVFMGFGFGILLARGRDQIQILIYFVPL